MDALQWFASVCGDQRQRDRENTIIATRIIEEMLREEASEAMATLPYVGEFPAAGGPE